MTQNKTFEVNMNLLRRVRELAGEVLMLAVFAAACVWLFQVVVGGGSFAEVERALLHAMALTGGIAMLLSIGIVALMEIKSRVQALVQPSSDEHRRSVVWWGLFHSDDDTPESACLEALKADPAALALYLGHISLGSAVRSVGRYILFAIVFLATVWAFQPFAASFAP